MKARGSQEGSNGDGPGHDVWRRTQALPHECGLTQEELAERSGLSARGISDLERGRRSRPYFETVRLLASALGLGRRGPSHPRRACPAEAVADEAQP